MKKFVALPDIHYPYHDKASLRAVEGFLADFRPDYLIYLGDQLDMKMILDIWKNNIKDLGNDKPIVDDYRGFDEMMTRHQKLCGKVKTIFIEGNHEERIPRYLQQQPIADRSNIELDNYFQFKKRGIEFIRYNKYFKLGKLYFMHGIYYNQYHAKKHVDAYKRSVIYGHTHSYQTFTDVSPFDANDIHVAKSIGCLANKNPDYKKNAPSSWVHGFDYGYVLDNGIFNDYFIKINKGRFLINGKEYK